MANYEDLVVFQRAIGLMVAVYRTTESFPRSEQYGITSQLRRAALSVVSQIAEGHGRLTPGECRQLLSQARGSLFEVEAQTIAAAKLAFLDPSAAQSLRDQIRQVAKPLAGLVTYVLKLERRRQRRPVDGGEG